MTDTPLVSVAMPCYNRAATLPLALASLAAQTVTDWECVLVDDGSTDHSAEVAAALGDPRIRIVRLPHRMGRGAARQVALEAARGEFFCLLDSDDWFYPDKLARQLEVMACLPEVGAVACAIAVVDSSQQLIGVRGRGPHAKTGIPLPPIRGTLPPPLSRAPFMLRMALARQCHYDPRLRRAEDTDFLLQLLARTHYSVISGVAYTYCEERVAAPLDNLSGYSYLMRVIWKHRRRAYGDAARQLAVTAAKAGAYGLGALLGMGDWLIRRRSLPPTPQEIAEFEAARTVVLEARGRLFGLPVTLET